MDIETAVTILNANSHRGETTWRWSVSIGEVEVPNRETMHIHPTDAKLIAEYYNYIASLPPRLPPSIPIPVPVIPPVPDSIHVPVTPLPILPAPDVKV